MGVFFVVRTDTHTHTCQRLVLVESLVWWVAYSVSVAVEHVYTQNGLFAGLSPYCGREGTEGQEGQHDSVGVDLPSTLCSLSVPLWDTVGSVYTIAGSQRRSRGGGGRGGEKAEQEQQN